VGHPTPCERLLTVWGGADVERLRSARDSDRWNGTGNVGASLRCRVVVVERDRGPEICEPYARFAGRGRPSLLIRPRIKGRPEAIAQRTSPRENTSMGLRLCTGKDLRRRKAQAIIVDADPVTAVAASRCSGTLDRGAQQPLHA
jgi:hypothetical protein